MSILYCKTYHYKIKQLPLLAKAHKMAHGSQALPEKAQKQHVFIAYCFTARINPVDNIFGPNSHTKYKPISVPTM